MARSRVNITGISNDLSKDEKAYFVKLLKDPSLRSTPAGKAAGVVKSPERSFQRYTTSAGQQRQAPAWFAKEVKTYFTKNPVEKATFKDTAREARRRDINSVILRNEVYATKRHATEAAKAIEKQARDPSSNKTKFGKNAQDYYKNRATSVEVKFMLPGDKYKKFDSKTGKMKTVTVDEPSWRVVVSGSVHSVYESYETLGGNRDEPDDDEDFNDDEFDDMQTSFEHPDDDE